MSSRNRVYHRSSGPGKHSSSSVPLHSMTFQCSLFRILKGPADCFYHAFSFIAFNALELNVAMRSTCWSGVLRIESLAGQPLTVYYCMNCSLSCALRTLLASIRSYAANAFALTCSITFRMPIHTDKSVKTSTMLPWSVNGGSCRTDRSFIIPLCTIYSTI